MNIETVKVESPVSDGNPHGYIVINKSDFTEDHVLFDQDAKEKAKADAEAKAKAEAEEKAKADAEAILQEQNQSKTKASKAE